MLQMQLEKDNNYTVYMHKFPNNKVYIGITCRKPEHRWNNGKGYKNNIYLENAIMKYGWQNIQHLILFEKLTKEKAEQKEIELIKLYNANNRKFGYNISSGGMHKGKNSEETRIKIGKSNKGRIVKEETRIKISISHKGKKMSEETKEKIRISKIGEKNYIFGKHLSEETKRKKGKRVKCIETGIVYYTIMEAENKTNISHVSIVNNCKGKRKTAGKMHWEYVK